MNHASEATVVNTTVAEIVAKNPGRPDAVVLTNDNFDSYVDKQLHGDKPAEPAATEPKADAAKDDKKTEAKAAAAPVEEEIDHPDKSQKGKLNERFSDLTNKRKAAEAKAEAEAKRAKDATDRAEAAERERNDLKAKYEPPKSDELGPKPELAQFTDATEWGKALEDWTATKTRKDDSTKARNEAETKRREAVAKTWDERQGAARKEIADYDEKLAASPAVVSDIVRDAIVESEIGPKILYHLAEHPEIAEKWRGMTGVAGTVQVLKEVGKLEATLGGAVKAEPKKEAAAPAAQISKAPPPISPLNGGGGGVLKLGAGDEVPKHWTFEDYKKARRSGQIQ